MSLRFCRSVNDHDGRKSDAAILWVDRRFQVSRICRGGKVSGSPRTGVKWSEQDADDSKPLLKALNVRIGGPFLSGAVILVVLAAGFSPATPANGGIDKNPPPTCFFVFALVRRHKTGSF